MAKVYMFTKGGYEGCSFGETVFASRAKAEQVLRSYQSDTQSEYYNHPRDEFPWSVDEFEFDDEVPKIHITKNKPYRLNFEYAGLHYSIHDSGELYEEFTSFTCKEDPNFYYVLGLGTLTHTFMPTMKPGQTYRDTDLTKIQQLVNKYIEYRG